MRSRPAAGRSTATALFALLIAGATAPAHAAPTAPATSSSPTTAPTNTHSSTTEPAAASYRLTLSATPDHTDFGHRKVDLSGTLTRSDGTPVVDASISVGQGVMYATWNPWGDPINPVESEGRSLGTLRTDESGRFTLDDVAADRWLDRDSVLLSPLNQVEFYSTYNSAEDPSDHDVVYADATVSTSPVASTLTYKVNKTQVHTGDTLTVTGKVSWPAGHGPVAGTRVFLRTYYENQYNAQTTTDGQGNFTVSAKIRSHDREFVIFSAPHDYYISGAEHTLPVKVGTGGGTPKPTHTPTATAGPTHSPTSRPSATGSATTTPAPVDPPGGSTDGDLARTGTEAGLAAGLALLLLGSGVGLTWWKRRRNQARA
ncbi:acyl carrier protein [Streptomyces sp. NPDC001070]